MPKEDIRQLKAELESLRNQNQQLKIVAHRHLSHQGNGHKESVVMDKEPILSALSTQLSELKAANEAVQKAFTRYTEVQNSLDALLPALELQMEGWSNEIRNLKDDASANEQAYAELVTQLDQKISRLQHVVEEDPYTEVEELKTLVQSLKKRIEELENQPKPPKNDSSPSPKSDDDHDNPFTSLNIFGA
ncbi:MAG: hypothetical protein AAF135_26800 [Bacteroidota bacterium]